MPNPSIVRFDYDSTGVNPDNLVSNEIHALTDNFVRAFAPTYGPFFADSVVLFDNANDRRLVRGTDYSITELNQDITLRLGKEVSSVILVLNAAVSNAVRLTYQVVGGLYQNQADAIANMYSTLLQDNRPIEWSNILGKPLEFPPTTHLHNLEDVYGFEPMVNALERIRSAVILSDVPAFEALIDWVSANLATTASSADLGNLTTYVSQQFVTINNSIQQEVTNRTTGDTNLLAGLQAEVANRIAADNTKVTQGGGVDQLNNVIKMGWGTNNRVKVTVDSTDMGNVVFDGQLNGALGNYLPLSGGYLTGKLWSVAQNSNVSQNDGSSSLEIRNAGGSGVGGDGAVAGLSFHCQGMYAIKMHLRADGYFGIGGWSRAAWSWYTAPDGSMYSANTISTGGSLVAAGDVYAYSDPRLKDNVVKIEDALAICKQLDGVTFTWNNKSQLVACKVGKRDYGVLADQVKAIMPEIVAPSPKQMDCDDVYDTVAYEKIVPVLLEAVKELLMRLEVVESKVSVIDTVVLKYQSVKDQAKSFLSRVTGK